ncbi:MAG: DNA mismatch repair endonuclease MutL, partial [Candidatus Firestonebacteria bacterium]
MGNIKTLPEELVKKISAGEVIERPASVIKELLENSLDAKSERISVEIRQGGKKLIKIRDDGFGMDPQDLKLCVDRHTTSKIRELEDIYNISTLGFRGEALSSIAAVSRLEIISSAKSSKKTYKLAVNGREKTLNEHEALNGTLVSVSELFYNVPARLKFLKSNETETGHIHDIVTNLALYNYGVSFELIADSRKLLFVEKVNSLKERLYQIFGENQAKNLLCVINENSGVKIKGYISTPQELKNSRNYIHTFVNGRLVNEKTINHAIIAGFGNLLPFGKYPIAILFVDINPTLIDVNVHPTKR